MSHYHHLTIEEREKRSLMKDQGKKIRDSISVTDYMGDVSYVYRTVEVSKGYTITTA